MEDRNANWPAIAEKIRYGYDRFIVPAAMALVPIEMEDLAVTDESGEVTGHLSLSELSQHFGKQYTLTPFGEHHIEARWSFSKKRTSTGLSEESMFVAYLEAMGLQRLGEDGDYDAIDFSALSEDGFVFMSALERSRIVAPEPEAQA